MKKIFLLFAVSLCAAGLTARVKLPYLMSDGMVLQQRTKASVWGEAGAGKKVTVSTSWDGKSYTATADSQGDWLVKVDTPSWGGPYTIDISDGDKTTLRDVMIGEVWVCSGQSNMQFRVRGSTNQPHDQAAEAILGANRYPQVRSFWVLSDRALEPQKQTKESAWQVSDMANVPMWSAVAYSFARHLTDALGGVPVGIITASYGGSNIMCWMDRETIARLPPIPMAEITLETSRPQNIPTLFYNAMIAPLFNYTARGFLWYQGETNKKDYKEYPAYQAAMAELWRRQWGNPDMPFYFTQIAPFSSGDNEATAIPLFVEAQIRSLGLIPRSGIAATTDLGEEHCIHPGNKEPVGQRLALLALNDAYGVKALTPTGPIMKEVRFEKSRAIVTFDHAAQGVGRLKIPIRGFELAGEDRKFYPATGQVYSGKPEVYVSAEEVPNPVALRYAFKNWPGEADLVNSYGLPAFPFRTDDWDDIPAQP